MVHVDTGYKSSLIAIWASVTNFFTREGGHMATQCSQHCISSTYVPLLNVGDVDIYISFFLILFSHIKEGQHFIACSTSGDYHSFISECLSCNLLNFSCMGAGYNNPRSFLIVGRTSFYVWPAIHHCPGCICWEWLVYHSYYWFTIYSHTNHRRDILSKILCVFLCSI